MKSCKSWLLTVSLCAPLVTQAAEPESCASVRLIDIGWASITVTTAVARQVLKSLGYKTKINLFSVPVTRRSLTDNGLNVLPGNWISTMTNDIRQYAEKDTVETLRANLEGAKYTLTVPQHIYGDGLHSFANIAKFSGKLGNKVCGIEPDNNGNHVAQSIIDRDAFELGKFKLMESSEAGMPPRMQRVIWRNQWMVFLDRKPHPIDTCFQTKYLESGDDFFGPNHGDATIYTSVRKGYAQEYTNIGQLLKNLSFTLEIENKLMDAVLNENKKPEEAAKTWLKGYLEQLDAWLIGVTTRDGQPAAAATGLAFAKQATDRSFPVFDGS